MPTVYYQSKTQKMFGKKSSENIGLEQSGLIEACYDGQMGAELLAIGKKHFFPEGIAFICGVNHLLLKKAGMASKLAKLASLDDGNLPAQMEQVFATYVQPDFGDNVVNVSHDVRARLRATWTTVKATQAVRQMLDARNEIVKLTANDALSQHITEHVVSKRLFQTLKTAGSPTDKDVMKKLEAQAPQTRVRSNAPTG